MKSVFQIPKTWTPTNLGEICLDLQYGYTASGSAEPCGPRFLRITDIQEGHVNWSSVPYCAIEAEQVEKYALREGDIVFARTGGTVGKSFIINSVPEPSVFASYLIRLTPHPEIVPRYLYYFFQSLSYWEQIGLKKGGLQGNVNATTLSSLELPLGPTNEQHRIVAKIEELFSELDKGVQSLETAREQLNAYRQTLLARVFEGKLTAKWRESRREELEPAESLMRRVRQELDARYSLAIDRWQCAIQRWKDQGNLGKRPVKPKRQAPTASPTSDELSGLPTLPHGWKWVKLGELVWSVRDGPHYSPTYVPQGIPFITGGHVRPRGIQFESANNISPELHLELCERCKPEKGDVLYTKGGTTGIARVNTYDHEFNVWVHVAVLKLADSIRPFYLQHALNSPRCYAQAQKYTHGVGNQDLGLTRMVNIILPMCSVAEQERLEVLIDELTSELDEMETAIDSALKKAESLRQAIFRKAFSGRLVAQDPNDEPASVLLDRIRAEKQGGANDRRKNHKNNGKKEAA